LEFFRNLEPQEVIINLEEAIDHYSLVELFSPCVGLNSGDEISLVIKLGGAQILYSDHLLLVINLITDLKERNIKVNGKLDGFDKDSQKIKYASRVNFFDHLGLKLPEEFDRHDSSGKFTEIVPFNGTNSHHYFRKVIQILTQNGIHDNMLSILHYCLWEVIDNVLNHSSLDRIQGNGKGWLCAQYFPQQKKIRIIISDSGIGIHTALTDNLLYSNLTEKDALRKCIEKGVTNGKGQGFGLYATAEMIKKNRGSLIIHSGGHRLVSNSKCINVESAPRWQGTFVFLEVNTNNIFDPLDILSKSQIESFMDLKESLGLITELW